VLDRRRRDTRTLPQSEMNACGGDLR
jgi:hypothetical protein